MLGLMIQTKDNRKFFTHEKNFPQLIEFSKYFKAEISIVNIAEQEILLDLPDLAPALCDKDFRQKIKYEIIEVKLSQNKKKRKDIIKNSVKIKEYIKEKLLAGEIVELKELQTIFKKMKITNACLCQHFALVREQLLAEGFQILKMGGGKYKLQNP